VYVDAHWRGAVSISKHGIAFVRRVTDNDRDARYSKIPDVRDGLTREERIVMYVLHETQQERGGRNVPTAMLLGPGVRTLLYQS